MTEAEEERAAVLRWMRIEILRLRTERDSWPLWRQFLWALKHPIQYGKDYGAFIALCSARDAIEAGKHRGD